jgi:chromosome segregation ATPase
MYILKRIGVLAITVLTIATLSSAPLASANDGENTSDSTSHTSGSDRTTKTTTKIEDKTTEVHATSSDSLKSRAAELLQERREGKAEHTKEQRQKACTARKDHIETRLSNLKNHGQGHLDAFNALFEKIKAYQDKNNLAASNYDDLVAAATSAQAAATAAVTTVKSTIGTVDCAATDPATNVAASKTAIDDAKTALQAYRASLKNLVAALLQAKKAAAGTTPQTNDDNTDKTTTTTTSGGTQ